MSVPSLVFFPPVGFSRHLLSHCLPLYYFMMALDYFTILGTLEVSEIKQVMKKLGHNPTNEELTEMFSSVDKDGNNEIDFEEFCKLMASKMSNDPEKELKDAFNVFDSDHSGSIDRNELAQLMKKLGQALTDAQIDSLMEEVDANGDGEISFEEFKDMMVRFCFVLFYLIYLFVYLVVCSQKLILVGVINYLPVL